jgi:hypothetical protein
MTALYDAIGHPFNRATDLADKRQKVIIAVFTYGSENAFYISLRNRTFKWAQVYFPENSLKVIILQDAGIKHLYVLNREVFLFLSAKITLNQIYLLIFCL